MSYENYNTCNQNLEALPQDEEPKRKRQVSFNLKAGGIPKTSYSQKAPSGRIIKYPRTDNFLGGNQQHNTSFGTDIHKQEKQPKPVIPNQIRNPSKERPPKFELEPRDLSDQAYERPYLNFDYRPQFNNYYQVREETLEDQSEQSSYIQRSLEPRVIALNHNESMELNCIME